MTDATPARSIPPKSVSIPHDLLPTILRLIPYTVFWKDRDSVYLGCNENFAQAAGIDSPDDIVGLTDFDLPWSTEEAESYRADDRAVIESGVATLHTLQSQRTPTGETTWLDTSKVPLRSADGEIIGVLGIFADVTEQRNAQQQLQETQRNLEDAIEAIDAGIVMYDRDERLVFCNRKYRELYQVARPILRRGRAYESILREWFSRRPDLQEVTDIDTWVGERLRKHRERGGSWEQHVTDKVIRVSDRPTHSGGVVSLRTDITELKEIELELRAAKEAAETASHAKTGFLANMSHEIRTPLTAILGFTDLLLDSECDVEQRSVLEIVKRNGEHLLVLINDILDLTKIESGKVDLCMEGVSPVSVAMEVVELLSWRAEEKGIGLNFAVRNAVPRQIRCDATRLRQVLVNLVGNAIKFTEQGRVRVSLSRVDTGSGSMLEFEVKDTGIGMAEAQCQAVFEAFRQADSSTTRRFGGTGLGLTISRRLAQLLGGDVRVQSVLGKGSCFTLGIPVRVVDCAHLQSPRESVAEPGAATQRARVETLEDCLILLAEDGPDNQRLITYLLRKAGAEVVVANDGQQALDAIAEHEARGRLFDVVLMDMQMPVLDGYSATPQICQRWPQLPVVALTAHALSTDRARCLAAGCREYLTKPLDRRRLLQVCRALGGTAENDSEPGERSQETRSAPPADM